jgi:Protein of unknown function (DUF3105)
MRRMRAARIAAAAAVVLLTSCSGAVSGTGQPADAGAPASGVGAGGTPTASGGGIQGVVHRRIDAREHVDGQVDYPDSPPFGGPHATEWADCTGTVYTGPVPDENAVHSLEHGAVWVAYRPGLGSGDLDALRGLVRGTDYTFLSPYPGLDHAVSVQAWGYQLRTDDARDPRLRAFVTEYRQNPETAPEYGATCTNPGFPVG